MRFHLALGLLFLALPGAWSQETGSAARMQAKGLVEVRHLDPTIQVALKYATADNFMHAAVYGDLRDCYLQREAAEKLVKAQAWLRQRHPGRALKVFDGARPRRVQERMWQIVKGTEQQNYVADPAVGSLHNYGVAVDVTLVDETGAELDMGTPCDFLGELAQPRHEARFLALGRLTEAQVEHRRWLREAMQSAGFTTIPTEWWHFNALSLRAAKATYELLE
jgi:zinc D-Ala-D-Ala dipeptidase